ncbi:Uncharacterised protein [Serratia marcescens]|nr:Uncharacterised protein [Serratia marcescens]CVC31215.1 Uncharacterised protein [Serratia marcescens]CVE35260.1 Uncharacterised protein [Serratia marcescens]CVH25894.1 Uncharacterised protein [Serratia marcescens]
MRQLKRQHLRIVLRVRQGLQPCQVVRLALAALGRAQPEHPGRAQRLPCADIAQHQPIVLRQPQRAIEDQFRQPVVQQRNAPGDVAGGMVQMQRLPMADRPIRFQRHQNAFRRLRRTLRQQPVAARDTVFIDIAADVQRDALPGLGLFHDLILGVQAAHPHRRVGAGQPQRISHLHPAAERGAGHHQPRPFDAERTVNRQAKTARQRVLAGGQRQQMRAQRLDTLSRRRRGNKQRCIGPALARQFVAHLAAYLADTRRVHPVGLGQRHRQRRAPAQAQDRQMFAGLRHHAVVAGHHQQRMVDAADARQHVGEEFLVAGHVDKAQHPAVRLRPVGVTQIDGHAAALLFRQAIRVDPGDRLQQGGFAMIDMAGGGDDHEALSASISAPSCSRQRRSSHSRPSPRRPITGCGRRRQRSANASSVAPRPSRGVKVSA